MKKEIEERILCEDEKRHRYTVLKLRHYPSKVIGGERIELRGTHEWALLEGHGPGRHVNEIEAGTVFEVVVDGTIIRRIAED